MKLIAPLALALALVAAPGQAQEPCGGLLEPPCPTPTPTSSPTPVPTPVATPKPSRIRITLRAQRSVVRSGGHVSLRGRVRGLPSRSSILVELIKSGPGASGAEDFTYLNPDGRFFLNDEPELSTTYRVSVEGVTSRAVRVRALPRFSLAQRTLDDGLKIRTFAIVEHQSRKLPRPGHSRAHFYLLLSGEEAYRRVGIAKVGRVRCPFYECFRKSHFVVRDRVLLERAERVVTCFSGRPFLYAGFAASCPPRLRAVSSGA